MVTEVPDADVVLFCWMRAKEKGQIKPIFALSPQAKGNIESPHDWLQADTSGQYN